MCERCGNEHSERCRYDGSEKLNYALLEINDKNKLIIAASEFSVLDAEPEWDMNDLTEYEKELDSVENEAGVIVYGGVLFQPNISLEKGIEHCSDCKNCMLIAIEDVKDKDIRTAYFEDIEFYEEKANSENYIPFAALMHTDCDFKDRVASYSFFPRISTKERKLSVVESMFARPFVLACREADRIDGLNEENWREYVSMEKLEQTYKIADLVLVEKC